MKSKNKTISVALSALILWQSSAWAYTDICLCPDNTLQPRLLFSSHKTEDAFSLILSGYLGFSLTEIERDPDLRNVPRFKQAIDEKLRHLRSSDKIPEALMEKLTKKVKYDPETASIEIDMGNSKIRYFDHNVPGAAFAERNRGNEEYEVTEKKLGRYFTRQVISKKTLPDSGTEKNTLVGDNALEKTASGQTGVMLEAKEDRSPETRPVTGRLFSLPKVIAKYIKNLARSGKEKVLNAEQEKEKVLNAEIAALIKTLAEKGVEMCLAGMDEKKLSQRPDPVKDLEAYCVVKDKKTLKHLLERRLKGEDNSIFDAVFNPRKRLESRKEEGKEPLKIVHIIGGRRAAAITEEITKMAGNGLVDLTIIPGAVDDGITVRPGAVNALSNADAVLYGPTDIESNIASALISGDISTAIKDNHSAAKILISNSADKRGVEPFITTTSSQLERLYRYMTGQQRYKVNKPDTGKYPMFDHVNYVIGQGGAFEDDVFQGLYGAEYYQTPEASSGEYNRSVTVDTIISLCLLKQEGFTPGALVWEASFSRNKDRARSEIDPQRINIVKKIVDHYADEENFTIAEKRHTPQGYLYAPSSAGILVKLAREFISGRGSKVLDLGSGAGKAAAVFSVFAGHVTGVEIDSDNRLEQRGISLLEAGRENIDKLSVEGLVDKNRISLKPGDFLDKDFDFSEFDMIYIFWPYKTAQSGEYARKIVDKLLDPEKGMKDKAVFAVNAPGGDALNVFVSSLEMEDIKYETWQEMKEIGRLIYAFRKKIPASVPVIPGEGFVDVNNGISLPAKPYLSGEAGDLLRKWKVLYGDNNAVLIDIYYNERELKVPVEATGFTPQGAIHSETDMEELIWISEKFLSGKKVKVLDAGSGNGKAVAFFSLYADHVTGAEIDSRSRSGRHEDRLFEVGQQRIEFLAEEGIVDRNKITLTDDDFLDPEFDLSGYDVVYHYWAFNTASSGHYNEMFMKKLTDPEKGLKPGGIFILNSLLREVSFPALEKMDVSAGKNITVYKRSFPEKRTEAIRAEFMDESSLFAALSGAEFNGKGNNVYRLSPAEEKNVFMFIGEKGFKAGQVKLFCPDRPGNRQLSVEGIKTDSDFDRMDIYKGFVRLLGRILPEGHVISTKITEKHTIEYLENISDKGRNVNEQHLLKKYDPAACGIGKLYTEGGFTQQLVRVLNLGNATEYELIAFRSKEPYSRKKARNMLSRSIFSKYAQKDFYVDEDGFTMSISRFTSPFETRMRSNVYSEIIKGIPERSGILSIGVGTGVFEEDFIKSGYSVTGVDITPEVLARAAQRGIHTVEGDADTSALWEELGQGEKYSAVLFAESLEYFEDPKSLFRMARGVLSEKGKIYILARNIPGNRREQGYEQALEKAGFSITRGSGSLFFGETMGMRMITGELAAENSWDEGKIINNAATVIAELVHNLMFLSAGKHEGIVPGGVGKEKGIALLVDTELSTISGKTDIAREIEKLIRLLSNVKYNNDELAGFLDKLEILPVKGSSVSGREGLKKYKNIIAVTRVSNKSQFEHIIPGAIVAAIQDKDLPDDVYLPVLEVTLFAIGKYLDLGNDVLEDYYGKIPNVKTPEELRMDGEFFDIFGAETRSFVISLPHARNLKTSKSVAETMAIIQSLLKQA